MWDFRKTHELEETWVISNLIVSEKLLRGKDLRKVNRLVTKHTVHWAFARNLDVLLSVLKTEIQNMPGFINKGQGEKSKYKETSWNYNPLSANRITGIIFQIIRQSPFQQYQCKLRIEQTCQVTMKTKGKDETPFRVVSQLDEREHGEWIQSPCHVLESPSMQATPLAKGGGMGNSVKGLLAEWLLVKDY